MSNYPDDFNASAHNARHDQADCLVDDWHTRPNAIAVTRLGADMADQGDDLGYNRSIYALTEIRAEAFDDCNCGRCADSNNWATDGESLINAAMVSA